MKTITFLSVLLATGMFSLWCISCSSRDADAPAVSSDAPVKIESAVTGYANDEDPVPESLFDGFDLSQIMKMAERDADDGYAEEYDEDYYDEGYEEGIDDDETYYEDVESDDDEGEASESDDEEPEYEEDEGTEDEQYTEDEDSEDYDAQEDSVILF